MPSRSNFYLKGLTQPKCQFSNVLHQTGLPILTTAPSRCKQDPSQSFFSLVLNWKFYETSFLWLLMLPQPFTGLVQMRPCWPPTPAVPALSQTKVEDSPLSATRSCFVRVSHCGERDFQQDGKAALSPRSLLCQILFTSFPRTAACTVYSQQHPCLPHRSLLTEDQLAWDSVFPRATQKSWAEVILKFGSPRGSVKEAARPAKHESNYTVLCTHRLSNSAANIKSSRTRSCITHLGISSRKSELQ